MSGGSWEWELGLTDVGAVDEAEEVEEGDGGDGVEVELPAQLAFCDGVELDQGVAVPGGESSAWRVHEGEAWVMLTCQ